MKYCLSVITLLILLSGCDRSSIQLPTVLTTEQQAQQSFHYLQEYIGKKPDAVDLWHTEPLRSELLKILGDSNCYHAFVQEMTTAKEIKRDHRLYSIAARADSTTQGYTMVLFDTTDVAVSIIRLKPDTLEEFTSDGMVLYWPDEVRNLIFNYQQWQVYEGSLPCKGCAGPITRFALRMPEGKGNATFFLQQSENGNNQQTYQQRGFCQISRDAMSGTVVYRIPAGNSGSTLELQRNSNNEIMLPGVPKGSGEVSGKLTLKKI